MPDYAAGADYQRRLQRLVDGIAAAKYRSTLDFAAGVKAGRDAAFRAARAAQAARAAAVAERARRVPTIARPAPRRSTAPTAPRPAPSMETSSACGGDLPPCYVLMRESKGNPRALNAGSGASGLWQFMDGTWAGYGGYSKAMYAPVAVQNAKARLVWNHGAGCSAWSAC